MGDVRDGVRLNMVLPGSLEAYEHDDGTVYIWDPVRHKHVGGLTLKAPRETWKAALCNLGYDGAPFELEPVSRGDASALG